MPPILIYTSTINNRLKYIVNLFFRDLLNVEHKLTTDVAEFTAYEGPKICYSRQAVMDGIFIPSHGLLFENGIKEQKIHITKHNSYPIFFASDHPSEIPFDIFSAAFYLVTRYEEYLPHMRDHFDRFEAKDSLAFKEGFLTIPLVNIWVGWLKDTIIHKYSGFVFPKQNYKYVSTIDIDNAYAYLEKGVLRTCGALAKSLIKLDTKELKKRLKVLFGKEKDPYDTYDYQLVLQKKYDVEMIYFFLLGDYAEYDRNVSANSHKLQMLMKGLADYAAIGIHPSFASNENMSLLKKEVLRLSGILKRDTTKSRQHFLKLRLPDTYRNLMDLDIYNDYTMGYASEIGFRASICNSFNFYDLDIETESKLRVHPFAVMDATLKYYMKIPSTDALINIKPLVDSVRDVDGTFMSLWHNESLSDDMMWKGWKNVYKEMVEYATDNISHKPTASGEDLI